MNMKSNIAYKDLPVRGDFYFHGKKYIETTIHTRFCSIHTWVKPACEVNGANKMKTIVNCIIAYFVEA